MCRVALSDLDFIKAMSIMCEETEYKAEKWKLIF